MRYSIVPLIAAAAWGPAALAQGMPADPVKHLDGYWYGEDRKIEVSVKDGVMTVEVNESENSYVQSLKMPVGTVIARFAGAKVESDRLAHLTGECWVDGQHPQLSKCNMFQASLMKDQVGDIKSADRLKLLTMMFRRKEHMAEYSWQYRK